MKDFGAAKKILGTEVITDRKSSVQFFSQQDNTLRKFFIILICMMQSITTHIAPHFGLSALQYPSTAENLKYMPRVPYSCVVGSSTYGMVCSGHNLSYAMSLISRYMTNPGRILESYSVDFQVPSWHIQSLLKVWQDR
jgi:hypothetical protein